MHCFSVDVKRGSCEYVDGPLSYIAIDREFRLHSRRVLPNFFALPSIEYENQLADFYNPGTTHVQHIYPLVRHKQVD